MAASAQAAGIDGRWVSSDPGGRPRAVIEISREGTRLSGRIVEFFPRPDEEADPVCDRCPGNTRGHSIRGLSILALEAESDAWRGTVLDPESGETYTCRVTISPDGRNLELRGYVGIPLFGRSERWVREGSP
jgi:uncharacterized protein (DUF2147 family)